MFLTCDMRCFLYCFLSHCVVVLSLRPVTPVKDDQLGTIIFNLTDEERVWGDVVSCLSTFLSYALQCK
uniref:Putative secreted protein n=1 Tax=Anopheles marajoara TaxID=58244 RepID=A0A2M4CFM7_9DIPT